MKPIVRKGVRVVGFDDGPFRRSFRGNIPVVGTVFRGGEFLDGMVATKVRRDGWNATSKLATALERSRYFPQLHYIMLDGIALGGFNVVDIFSLWQRTGLPVVVVMRREPDLDAVRRAVHLLPRGPRRWQLIQQAGPIDRCENVFVQRAGIELDEAEALVRLCAVRGHLPEPLRIAHMIAGALVTGEGGRRP